MRADPSTPITPTPFGSASDQHRNPAVEPIAISLVHLAANPEFFEGSTLQLSGGFRKLPKLACGRDPHPGPATWGIIGEGLLASASGYDAQLRSLLAENQPITAEGRWLHFVGPVGCGKSAPVQELWYLSVDHIIEPNPLAKNAAGQITQNNEPTIIAAFPENPTAPTQATIEIPPNTPSAEPTLTISATSTQESISTPAIEENITPSLTPTTEIITTGVPTTTMTATSAAVTNTPRPSSTPGPSPTPDSSLTPSPSPESRNFNNKGSIEYEDLTIETLSSGIADRWTLAVDTSDFITITVAPASNANIVISVLDENGMTLVEAQDQTPSSEVETIKRLNIVEPGIYEIFISTSPAQQTDYALMAMNSDSYSFSFQGSLVPSSPRTDSLRADNDHFWFFPASDGTNLSIRIIPDNQTDPYVELYDPQGSRVLTIDDTGTGETELLEDYEVSEDGLYAIRVGEFDFAAMTYQILLTKS